MTTTRFHVPSMDCPTEKDIIANRLGRLDGISGIDFDLLDRIVTVQHTSESAGIEAALREIGMKPSKIEGRSSIKTRKVGDDECCSHDHAGAARAGREQAQSSFPSKIVRLALAGAAAVAAEMVGWSVGSETNPLVAALALASMAVCGWPMVRKGFVAITTLTLNINFLMTIAVIGAIAIGEWPEAAMVTFLYAVAELVEARSLERARDAVRALMTLAPETARVLRDGAWLELATVDVPAGSRIQVRPGERIPLDGTIALGATSVDQAPITGESVPVDKRSGDTVFAGTINQQGLVEVTVTAGQGDTTLDRIARLIKESQGKPAATQRFVDRFARWYTPSIVALAILLAAIPPLAFGQSFTPWLYKALLMLVIACPCALVISTPVTVVSGLAAAARRGLLIKGGSYLEQAPSLRVIAIDKTGTLTEGRPRLTDVVPLGDVSEHVVLESAASLEATSDHPIARAVANGWSGAHAEVSDVRAVHGKGMEGKVRGIPLAVGSHAFAEEAGVCGPSIELILDRLEAEGKTTMVVWSGTRALGVLAVADAPRSTSRDAIDRLHARGVRLAMLTGDNPTTARAIAHQVGIDEVRAQLLPEAKLEAIRELERQYGPVAMVGDGVNDAPALAGASIGIAMGAAGSDVALETADVALMRDDLGGVAEFLELGIATARTLRINIAIAIGLKAVFFALAMLGLATLWMAVFADMGASLIVAANGLRLLRYERKTTT